ncbi:MAG: septum formation protein Maf [Bacteroidales bacterium]|nr:septum formation protein Maf [Bacteroidales bacterium]
MLLHQLLQGKRLVLASNSPRRQQLLAGLDTPFEVWTNPNSPPEVYPSTLGPEEIAPYLAQQKANHLLHRLTPEVVLLTSDTVVCSDGQVLGKPASAHEAQQMLRLLAGRAHTVVTGVTITTTQRQSCFSSATQVRFAPLSDEQIAYYVERYSPLDKAGAYGIQEWIGYVGIERIEGSYYNVMGLPVQRLHDELMRLLTSSENNISTT